MAINNSLAVEDPQPTTGPDSGASNEDTPNALLFISDRRRNLSFLSTLFIVSILMFLPTSYEKLLTLTNLFSIIYNNFHNKNKSLSKQQKSPGQTPDQSSRSGEAAAPKLYIFTPCTVPRAGYSVPIRTAARA
jgi:hypothetical protein